MSKMDKWWDGLSTEEKKAAKQSGDSGALDEGTQQSLEDAGVLKKGDTSGHAAALSDLRMRHD